jgi:hypothetical protein
MWCEYLWNVNVLFGAQYFDLVGRKKWRLYVPLYSLFSSFEKFSISDEQYIDYVEIHTDKNQ